MERLPAVVLAAGASSRMGRPKALLPLRGRPCVEHVLEAFRTAGQGPLILVLGSEAGAVLAGTRLGPDVIPIVNEGWRRGQTGSVKAGLRAVSAAAKGCFVMPADHPLVGAGDIAALAGRLAAAKGARGIFVPVWEGRRGHPLLLGGEHRMAILGMDDTVPLHAHVRMRSADVIPVEASGPGVLLGMNTESEYRAVLGAFRAGTSDARLR